MCPTQRGALFPIRRLESYRTLRYHVPSHYKFPGWIFGSYTLKGHITFRLALVSAGPISNRGDGNTCYTL